MATLKNLSMRKLMESDENEMELPFPLNMRKERFLSALKSLYTSLIESFFNEEPDESLKIIEKLP